MGTQLAQKETGTQFHNANATYIGRTLAVGEGNLQPGGVANVNMSNVYPTDLTMVTIQISGNAVQLSSASSPGNQTAPFCWEVPIVTIVHSLAEFKALIGANETNPFIRLYNPGPAAAHYKIIFTNLEV